MRAKICSEPEEKYFLSLVRCALRGEAPDSVPQDVNIVNILNLAKLHNLCELISYVVPSISPEPERVIVDKFKRLNLTGIAQQVHQDIEMEALSREFVSSGVDMLPLKGTVIKPLYPSPDMRSMCDIDILVRPEQLEAAKAIMLDKLGFNAENIVIGEHDLGFKKPPFINIELHHAMTDKSVSADAYEYYKDIWSLARLKNGSEHIYELSHEDFYIHHIEHMTKHYRSGGCGVRAFCDVFLLISKYQDEMDFEYIEGVLKRLGLDVFEKHVRCAALKWFGDGAGDEVSDIIESFVLHGGSFGFAEDKETADIASKYSSDKGVNKLSFYWKKIFLPYQNMKSGYPVLIKYPILLPFCWIHRAFDRLLFKRDRIKHQIELAASNDAIAEYVSHMNAVGLSK